MRGSSFAFSYLCLLVTCVLAAAYPRAVEASVVRIVPGDAPTIQAAIDMSTDGDTIAVEAGVWNETLDLGGRAITIRSLDGAAVTVIDAGGAAPLLRCESTTGSATARLEGFTLRGADAGAADGGALLVHDARCEIVACVITDNRAARGDVLDAFNAEVTFIECEVTGHAFAFGGAIRLINSAGTFEACTVEQNHAPLVATDSAVTITGGTFRSNLRSLAAGGAVATTGGSLTIDGTTFETNLSGSAGGAIAVRGTLTEITGATFSQNVVSAGGTFGGAIDARNGAAVTVTASAFDGNHAPTAGGAVAALGATWSIVSCTFDANHAASGGALSMQAQLTPLAAQVTGSTLTGDHADRGGALSIFGDVALTVTSTQFDGAAATIAGGALALRSASAASAPTAVLTDVAFAASSAGERGGDVWAQPGAALTITGGSSVAAAAPDGSVLAIDDGTAMLVAFDVVGAATAVTASALEAIDASVTVTGGTWRDVAGRAFEVTGGAFEVNATEVRGCASPDDGGGLRANDGVITLNGARWIENHAAARGGAIAIDGGSFLATDGWYDGNAAADGGAVWARGIVDFADHGATYRGNAGDDGGGLVLDDVSGDVTAAHFSQQSGSAIVVRGSALARTVRLTSCVFAANHAARGAAVRTVGPCVVLADDLSSRGDHADIDGGAWYLGAGADVTMTTSSFTGCTADGRGGAVAINAGARLVLNHATIDGCRAGTGGGAVVEGRLDLDDSSLLSCEATVGGGGAVSVIGGVLEGRFVVSAGNRANDGGAIAIAGGELDLRDVTFDDERALARGGAVFVRGTTAARIERCTFTGCDALEGGALSFVDAIGGRVARCVFAATTATVRGGAIAAAREASGASVIVDNTLVHDASAGSHGGAIAATGTGTTVRVVCSTIARSTAPSGGAMSAADGAAAALQNAVLAQCTATPLDGSATATFTLAEVAIAGAGNVVGAPGFRNAAANDFRLSGTSPAVDAGRNDLVPPTALVDLAGAERFVDDLDVPDSGVGDGPIVDLGAYERGPGDPTCAEDLAGDDGIVQFDDLLVVLSAWGPCPACAADLNGDGSVDFNDLIALLSAWGPCPE